MSKKKLGSDFPDFDSNLDFSFDDELGSDPFKQTSSKKGRGVVKEVSSGIISGAKSVAKDPSFLKQTLRKVLPREYGEIADATGEIGASAYELYDHSVKELKPKAGQIARKLDQFVPEGNKTLKKLTGKMMDLTGESRESANQYTSSQDDQAVTGMLAGIFEQNKTYAQMADKKQILRDNIARNQNNANARLLTSIERNTSVVSQYTVNVTQAYQKKMLELQLRSYLGNREYQIASIRFNQAFKAQLEGILKNTAMPEFQKITMSERFREAGKNQFAQSLFGDKSPLKRAMDSITATGKEFVEGLSRSLEMADMALESGLSIKEMNEQMMADGMGGMSKANMVGSMAGGQIVSWGRDKLADPLKARLAKNKKLTETLAKGARMAMSPGAYARNLQKSQAWQDKTGDYQNMMKGNAYRFLDAFLDNFRSSGPNASFKGGSELGDLSSPTKGFDKRAHISLVDVIPSHLAAIHREIKVLRTGNESTPLMTWDFTSGKLVSEKEMGDKIASEMKEKVRRSGLDNSATGAVKNFAGDANLPEATAFELKVFFTRLSRYEDLELTPKNIKKTKAYEFLSRQAKLVVDAKLKMIEDSEDKEREITSIHRDMGKIRSSTISMEKEATDYINAGYGDILSKRGVLSRNEMGSVTGERGIVRRKEGGGFERDEDAYAKFLEENGLVRSDINVKEAIKEMKPADLLKSVSDRFGKWSPSQAWDGVRKTKLYNWAYQKGKGAEGVHSGPMAQEVNKNLGEDAAPGGKKIDLASMNGALMASVKHLGNRLDTFIKGKFGSDELDDPDISGKPSRGGRSPSTTRLLQAIQKDIAKIAKSPRGMGGGNMGGGSGSGTSEDDQVGGYGSMVSSVISSISNLGIKVGGDIFSAAGNAFSFTKDKVAKPASEYITKALKDEKNPIRMGFGKLFESASKLGTAALDAGTHVVTDLIPNSLKSLKNFAKGVYDSIVDHINVAKDLYLPGGTEPVIRAIKLSSGFYIDSETGDPIFTMEKLLKAKGDIVDSAGNIILSTEERARGLIDRYGEKVKTFGTSIINGIVGAGFAAKDRLMAIGKGIKEKGMSVLSKMFKGGKDKLKGFDFGNGFDFGGSRVASESRDILFDIRDILLGKTAAVRKRMKDSSKKASPLEKMSETGSDSIATGVDSPPASGGSTGALLTGLNPFAGAGSSLRGLFGKGKGLLNSTGGKKAMGWLGGLGGGRLGKLGSLFGKKGGAGQMVEGFGAVTPSSDPIAAMIEEQDGANPSSKQGLIAALLKAKSSLPFFKKKNGDENGDGAIDGVDTARGKQEALKESRKKDFLQADLTNRYAGKGGLGGIMGMVGDLFGMMKKGLGGVFDIAGGLIKKLPGFGKLLRGVGSIIPKAGTVAKAALSVGRFAAGTAARSALWAATTALPAVGSALASVGGAALSVIGGVIGSPVVLGAIAVAAVGYGLYKLYKYANRDNATDLERMRLRQYGFAFNSVVERENHKLYTLEAYLEDGRVGYDRGKAYIIEKNVKPEDLAEIFGIDKEDTEHANAFATWFKDRFKPIFLTHLTALYAANPKLHLADVNKLTPTEALKYVQAAAFESGPYGIDLSPVKSVDSLSTDDVAIKQHTKLLIDKYSAEVKKGAKDTKLPPVTPPVTEKGSVNDAAAKMRAEDKAKEESQRKAAEASAMEASRENQKRPNLLDGDGGSAQKTNNVSDTTTVSSGAKSAIGNIPIAPGAPRSGEGGLQFIKLASSDINLNGLDASTRRLFLGMAEEYGQMTGKSIQVNSAFRSFEAQKRLHEQNPRKAAAPGKSLHEFGLALDINSSDADQLEKLGLMKKYGFTRPVGGEPWHTEPAGIQKNLSLARSDASLRAQMVDASVGRGGGGYGTMADATQYKRNTELAISLLDIDGKPITGTKTLASSSALPRTAANDPSASGLKLVSQNQGGSSSKNLSSPQELAFKSMAAADSEKSPSSSSGGSPASSGSSDMKEIITRNARRAGMDPNLMLAFAAVESDMNPNAKAKDSPAAGMFQFMPATWNEELARSGSKYSLPSNASPYDPEASTLIASEYLKRNLKTISSVKGSTNAVDAYLTHLLGPSGAKSILSSSPDSIAADIFPKAAASNPGI